MRKRNRKSRLINFLALLAITVAVVSLIYIVAEALYKPAKEYNEKHGKLANIH